MPLPPQNRISMLLDGGKAEVIDLGQLKDDPLQFRDMKKYADRLKDTRNKTGVRDANHGGCGHNQ